MQTSPLAAPLTLPCGARLGNRIAKAAMTEGVANPLNEATDKHRRLYRRWAEGGAGLLITGNVMVDRRYLERPGNVVIDGPPSQGAMARLSAWASAATGAGADIWMQISHAGRQSPKIVSAAPVGPSAVALRLPGGQFAAPRALEHSEIEDVIARFAFVASTAKQAGFTGVQVHAAHGYLLSEFLSPRANVRDDAWGGPLENRARLLLRVVETVRKKVGSGFPISVKLNSSDFQKGGFSFEECLQVVAWLNDVGVDLLEISGGSYEQPRMMGLDGLEPFVEAAPRRASTLAREAYFLQYAEEVARVAKMPLLVTGGFRSRAAMEEALATGAADVIGIARPLCVDPDAPAKLMSGQLAEAPAIERGLRLGKGVFGPDSKVDLIKALNGFASMSFFYRNIFRLAEGAAPKTRMALLPAFVRYQLGERRAGRELQGRRTGSA